MQAFRNPSGSNLVTLQDGRAFRVFEQRTPDGGCVGLRVDVTELNQARAQAEAEAQAEAVKNLTVLVEVEQQDRDFQVVMDQKPMTEAVVVAEQVKLVKIITPACDLLAEPDLQIL